MTPGQSAVDATSGFVSVHLVASWLILVPHSPSYIERTVIVIGAVDSGENPYYRRSAVIFQSQGVCLVRGRPGPRCGWRLGAHGLATGCPPVIRGCSTMLSTNAPDGEIGDRITSWLVICHSASCVQWCDSTVFQQCCPQTVRIATGPPGQPVRACCLMRLVSSVTCV